MTIASAILADNPDIYWKLDDGTGPVASDSSGNGRAGIYTGVINLGQIGPEAGTTCALLQTSGFIRSLAGSPRLVPPYSFDVWMAPMTVMPLHTVIEYNGASDSTGLGLVWTSTSQSKNTDGLILGGIAIGAASVGVFPADWHHYAVTITVGNAITPYLDGAVSAGAGVTAPNPLAATDPFVVGGVGTQLAYVAHAALYPTALSAARVAAHAGSAGALTTPAPIGGLVNAQDLLELIYAAVHTTYPAS